MAEAVGKLVIVVLGVAAVLALATVPVYLAWNHAVIYALPAAKEVTFPQAFGLAVLLYGFRANLRTKDKD